MAGEINFKLPGLNNKNNTITVSGDATGAGVQSLPITLATVNSNIGTYNNITITAKGLATAGSNVSYLTANQTITFTGDATGSGTTSVALTAASNIARTKQVPALDTFAYSFAGGV